MPIVFACPCSRGGSKEIHNFHRSQEENMNNNPYENLYPIEDPRALYGRRVILRRIFRRLFQTVPPRSLQIVGLARFGKSSVLNVIVGLKNDDYSDYFTKEFGLERERLNHTLVVQVNCSGLSIDAMGEPSVFWNLMDQQ